MMKKSFSLSSILVLISFCLGWANATTEQIHLLRSNHQEAPVEDVALKDRATNSKMVGDYTYWLGTIEGALRILFRCSPSLDQVFIYSLDQGGDIIPGSGSTFEPDTRKVHVAFRRIRASYEAKLVRDESGGNTMEGFWYQGGRVFPLNILQIQPTAKHPIPLEMSFLLEKIVTGDPGQLAGMVGYWSGYLLPSNKDDEKTFVVLQVEQLANGYVEPLLFLTDDDDEDDIDFPVCVRSLVVNSDGDTKIVISDLFGDNAIFEGHLTDGIELAGIVKVDDDDYTPSLVLQYSKDKPKLLVVAAKKE